MKNKKITTGHITEDKVAADLDKISKHRAQSDRLAWSRKFTKMENILENELRPVEDEILNLIISKRQPLTDKIDEIRGMLVADCIHPRSFLVHKGSYVECKFCNSKILVVANE